MELKKYAFVRNGIVEDIEERTYNDTVRISDLYHAEIIKDYFVEIPSGDEIEVGFLYDGTAFLPPSTGQEDCE